MAIKRVVVDNKEFNISYDMYNLEAKKDMLFLHGWGANREIMKVFKDYFNDFRLLFLDMPGFGKSDNRYVLTTKEYAQIVDKFLKELNFKKKIIIAHSFGGKVALLLEPDLLVLLASAGIVLKKPVSVRLKIKLFKLLKFIGLGKFRNLFVSKDVYNMNENMYQTFKNVVDEDFSSVFRNYKKDVLVFGGEEDRAVLVEAIKKQGELLEVTPFILKGDHYFFFNSQYASKNREIIVNEIRKRAN